MIRPTGGRDGVGFKYIGELIKQDKILIGGEESAGLSIRGHIPEKDGVLAGLLFCRMVARRGASHGKRLQDVFGKVGSFYPLRENFRLTPELKQKLTEKLRVGPSDFLWQQSCQASAEGRTDGRKDWQIKISSRGWIVGVLPAAMHGVGGARLSRGAEQGRPHQVE